MLKTQINSFHLHAQFCPKTCISHGQRAVHTRTGVHAAPQDKGKAILLHALTGPEGSRRLRLTDFKTIGT
jgi:hypothetical protein